MELHDFAQLPSLGLEATTIKLFELKDYPKLGLGLRVLAIKPKLNALEHSKILVPSELATICQNT